MLPPFFVASAMKFHAAPESSEAKADTRKNMSAPMEMQRPSVAIVGSGIAGLTAAWLLRERYTVTLFEAHAQPGMGAFSVDVPGPDGAANVVDVPTRVFCSGYYPHMEALFQRIGVQIEHTDHAGAFTDASGSLVLHYANWLLGGRPIAYLPWPGLRSVRSLRMAALAHRFFQRATRDMRDPEVWASHTLSAYLKTRKVSPEFVDLILLPALCVICTCSPEEALNYPADLILGYLTSGVMRTGVVRSAQGVADVVARLTQGVTLRCGTAVVSVTPGENRLQLVTEEGHSEQFDQVIMAAQAQQSAAMLPEALPARALLQQVGWAASEMTVHTNRSAVPVPGAPVNYRVAPGRTPEVTVDMAHSFPSFRHLDAVYQTWNPWEDSDEVLARFAFTRPIVTLESRGAMSRLRAEQSRHGLWYCGAYVADRVPLLEAAVSSALDVAAGLGVKAPWR